MNPVTEGKHKQIIGSNISKLLIMGRTIHYLCTFPYNETTHWDYRHSLAYQLIHTLQLYFLFFDWLFSNTRSVLKLFTELRTLRPDCARCSCWVIVTSTDPFFHRVNLLILFIFSGIFKWFKSSALALMLMFDQCTHLWFVHWTSINISARALDLNHFSRNKTYAFIDL